MMACCAALSTFYHCLRMTMNSLFDNVQGCVLYVQDLRSRIAFTTPSDALLTSLFIKYGRTTPLELFDDFLSLFQRADFHTDGVTMKSSDDIMDHIAEQRRADHVYSQEMTKSPHVHQARISHPPELVVELCSSLGAIRCIFIMRFNLGCSLVRTANRCYTSSDV